MLHRTWPNASASCAGRSETKIPPIAIDSGYLNERDDQLQETAGPQILVSKCDLDRWIGAVSVPTKGADEYAIAELNNDVSGSGFAEGIHSDSVEVGRCDCRD